MNIVVLNNSRNKNGTFYDFLIAIKDFQKGLVVVDILYQKDKSNSLIHSRTQTNVELENFLVPQTIIILNGPLNKKTVNSLNRTTNQIIYISTEKNDRPPDLKHIIYILQIGLTSSNIFNFPSELIFRLPPPIVNSLLINPDKTKSNIRIAYIGCPGSLQLYKEIISAFNAMDDIIFHLFTYPSESDFLYKLCNANIKWKNRNKFLTNLSKYDFILSESRIAIQCLANNKPVIVVGLNGFGGLVTKDNLEGHLKYGFSGRIGGSLYEPVPEKLIISEIRHAISMLSSKVDLNLDVSDEIIANYSGKKFNDIFKEIFFKAYFINKKLLDLAEFETLVPRLTKDIAIRALNNDKFVIIWSDTLTAIKIIDRIEYEFLNKIDEKWTIRDLIYSNGVRWNVFLQSLWREKIIYF